MAASEVDWKKGWKVYYWPTIGGRGLYARLMFQLGGAEWSDALQPGMAYPEMKEKFAKDCENSTSESFPMFAFPYIRHESTGFSMNQNPAIVYYLAGKFGLRPQNAEDDAHAMQLMLQALDCLSEAEMAYHPTARHGSYKSQKEAADKTVAVFMEERLDKHLSVLEKALAKSGGQWFFEGRITYVDVVVATFMRGYATSQQEHYDTTGAQAYPLLHAHRTAFEQQPLIKAFYTDYTTPVDDNSFMG